MAVAVGGVVGVGVSVGMPIPAIVTVALLGVPKAAPPVALLKLKVKLRLVVAPLFRIDTARPRLLCPGAKVSRLLTSV